MFKNFTPEKFKVKPVVIACTFLVSTSIAMFAACDTDDDDEDETTTSSVVDTQLLKNGDFEFFSSNTSDDGGIYYISDADDWSSSTQGTSSYTKSGVIDTTETAWNNFTDSEFADTLETNAALLTDDDSDNDDDYVDYNGLRSYDLPYVNSYDAIHVDHLNDDNIDTEEDSSSTEVWSEDRIANAKKTIENPNTHYTVTERDGKYYLADGTQVYKDGDNYYKTYDETKSEGNQYTDGIDHVLMVHNYLNSSRIGTAQKYTASTTISLEANTAAKISVWVKTAYLRYQGVDENTSLDVTQDRGAFIQVAQSVGSSSVGSTYIKNINTEKLIKDAGDNSKDSNGWLQYTIYVQGCDYASSELTISLGLGTTGAYLTEGYAFFDDLEVTKYASTAKMVESTSVTLADFPTCTLSDTVSADNTTYEFIADAKKEFVADDDNIAGGAGAIVDKRNSENYQYFIDLASQSEKLPVSLNPSNFTSVGLTVDTDGYTTSKTNNATKDVFGGENETGKFLYDYTKGDIDTSKDLLKVVQANNILAGLTGSDYADLLNTSLSSATKLPSVADDAEVFLMLSANGAAYTATLQSDKFHLDSSTSSENYALVSFWIKTSDLQGNTAATITLVDKADEDNTSSFTIDTTTVTTTSIDDEDDLYDGWVQCFFFINNDDSSADGRDFELKVQFGETTLKGTTVFNRGWLAITNVQILPVTEDEFSFTSEDTYAKSFTFSENSLNITDGFFDSVSANYTTIIEEDISNPSSYTGVNGGSTWTVGGADSTNFDVSNNNSYAGLINQDYFENYADKDWFQDLLKASNQASETDYNAAWIKIFGDSANTANGYTSKQPLLIVNKIQEYADKITLDESTFNANKTQYYYKENGVYVKVTEDDTFDADKEYYTAYQLGLNYGYIGTSSTISTSTYSEIAVRVKVSEGAVAYVYLIDSDDSTKILNFETGTSFWYDEEGNIMRGDDETYDFTSVSSIAYKLRTDGLYESTRTQDDGKLYANLSIYNKLYNNQKINYYDADGNAVAYDDLDSSVTYYDSADASTRNLVPHYLVSDDGTRLYQYKDGQYYYIETSDDTTITEKVVEDFDTTWAVPRYTSASSAEYVVCLDARYNAQGELFGEGSLGYDKDGNYIADQWINVNFYIHTNDTEKAYHLELWSGARETSGVNADRTVTDQGSKEGSYVIFDYAYSGVTESNYSSISTAQVNKIRQAYLQLLTEEQIAELPSAEANLNVFEQLFKDMEEAGTLSAETKAKVEAIQKTYRAIYNTFSLYDSSAYIPFNEDYAESNQSGYDFTYDATESLAYLSYVDTTDGISYKVFADYSTIDQQYSITTDEDDDDDDDDTTEDTTDTSNIWLLASSIALVAALIFALIAILIRNYLKKYHRRRVTSKNKYASGKRKRYIRKLGLDTTQAEEEEIPTDKE